MKEPRQIGMEEKTETGVGKTVESVFEMLVIFSSYLTDMLTLMGLEARLAVKSMVWLILLSALLMILLIATWLSVLMLFVFYLLSFHCSWLIAIGAACMVNVIMLGVVCFSMMLIKRNLSFPATRRQLQGHVENLKRDPHDAQSQI